MESSTTPFYPQFCLGKEQELPDEADNGYKIVHYRKNLNTLHLNHRLPHDQLEHVRDWILINTTCRGFRQLSKPLFFCLKTFGMTLSYPTMLRTKMEALRFPLEQDRPLALTRIRNVVFYGMPDPIRPRDCIGLLESVELFPSLTACTIVGPPGYAPDTNPWTYGRKKLPKLVFGTVPRQLKQLLQECGLRGDVRLDSAVWKTNLSSPTNALQEQFYHFAMEWLTYPTLRNVAAKVAADKALREDQ